MSLPHIIRLLPAPSQSMVLRVERQAAPALLEKTAFKSSSELPLSDMEITASLIPLIRAYIAVSSIARENPNVQMILNEAERVRQSLPYRPNPVAPPSRVGTRRGW